MNRPIQVKQTTDSENRGGKLWPQFFKCSLLQILYISFSYTHCREQLSVSLLYTEKIYIFSPFTFFAFSLF
jgi:hypothetical protein